MRIVIAGATGFLGRPLVARLLSSGHSVTVLTRRPTGQAGVAEVSWQPDGSAGTWAPALDGADAVINLAGEPIAARRWTAARKRAIVDSRLLSTRSLVDAMGRVAARPRLLISASGVGYYGDCGDEQLTEEAPGGHDFLGGLCVEWEQAAAAARAVGTRVVPLRTGLVLAADGGALKPMLLPFRLGLGGPIGDGRQYWPWIHRDDYIALVEFILTHPSLDGPINVTSPTPVTNDAFSRALARVLRRPCVFRVPAFALRLAMGELAEGLLLSGQRAMPARAVALGYKFKYEDLDAALRAILRP